MADGLRMARETPCDLILSDVCMGGGSGYELLEAIRSDPQFRDIPFVLITSTVLGDTDPGTPWRWGRSASCCGRSNRKPCWRRFKPA